MKRFEGRTVVITGASRGIGKGIAKRFGDEGANLVLAANEPSVDVVAEEFRASGASAISYVCDVTNKSEIINTASGQARQGFIYTPIMRPASLASSGSRKASQRSWRSR
jgi:NAD(P)-dependent dehydrogenase (short-subunit alcohol dehydrogenase family)